MAHRGTHVARGAGSLGSRSRSSAIGIASGAGGVYHLVQPCTRFTRHPLSPLCPSGHESPFTTVVHYSKTMGKAWSRPTCRATKPVRGPHPTQQSSQKAVHSEGCASRHRANLSLRARNLPLVFRRSRRSRLRSSLRHMSAIGMSERCCPSTVVIA